MSDFEDAVRDALSIRQIRHGRMVAYIRHEIDQEQVSALYSGPVEEEFWSEFRHLYSRANEDRERFLEMLEGSASGDREGTRALDRGDGSPIVYGPKAPKATQTIEPLPEPFVPGSRRGRGKPSGESGPIVRAIRRIGRLFGFGDK